MKKIRFIIFITISCLLLSCATRNLKEEIIIKPHIKIDQNKTIPGKPKLPEVGTIAHTLYKLSNEISDSFHIPVLKPFDKRKNIISGMSITKTDSYIEVAFKDQEIFGKNLINPFENMKKNFINLALIIKKYPDVIVQVLGHSDNQTNQELSDERAINIAELFYNSGLRNEIYAKGCSYKNHLLPDNSEANILPNRRVEVYIYPDIKYMIDKCK